MTSIADSSIQIQISSEVAPCAPSWFGEVVLMAAHLKKQGVYPPAPPTPGYPDGACSFLLSTHLPSDDLSGAAGALPFVMGRAAGAQCTNRSG